MDSSEKFLRARDSIVMMSEADRNGIGRLGEKTLHAVLKLYFEPDRSFHEVKVGRYYADIKNGDGIYEIQTAGFQNLRAKLEAFLAEYPVTVVYPMPYNKYIVWINEDGTVSKKNRSPKKQSPLSVFSELYKIKPQLAREGFRLCIMRIDLDEYRLLNGWSADRKRGSHRYERIPMALHEEIMLSCPSDYTALLPDTLPESFTTADLKREARVSLGCASVVLNVMNDIGAVERCGKSGHAFLYRKVL